jgi:hypothetical protein
MTTTRLPLPRPETVAAYRLDRLAGQSCYSPGMTIAETGADWAARLVIGARDGSVTAETGAGSERLTAVVVTIMGGGPSGDVTFLFDGPEYDDEPREAFVTYAESGVAAPTYLDRSDARDLWLALSRDPQDTDADA